MEKLLVLALVSLVLVLSIEQDAQAWTTVGLNFRATAPYVSDNANEIPVLGETSPTTKSGVTYQWLTIGGTSNRTTLLDNRLAGINYCDNSAGTPCELDVTLSQTGSYTVCAAVGDGTNSQSYHRWEILDNGVQRAVFTDADGTSGAFFDDATGAQRTAALWPSTNICVTGLVFSTTAFQMKIGADSAQAGNSTIAHISITLEAAGAATFETMRSNGLY